MALGETLGSVVERTGTSPELAVLMVSGAATAHLADIVDAVHTLLCPSTLVAVSVPAVLPSPVGTSQRNAVGLLAGNPGPVRAFRLGPDAFASSGQGPGDLSFAIGDLSVLAADIANASDPASSQTRANQNDSGQSDAGQTNDEQTRPRTESTPATRQIPGVGSVEPYGTRAPFLGVNLGSPGTNAAGPEFWIDDNHFVGEAIGFAVDDGRSRLTMARGFRPVGQPVTITALRGGRISRLGAESATEQLGRVLDCLTTEERGLAKRGLAIGVANDDIRDAFVRDEVVRDAAVHDAAVHDAVEERSPLDSQFAGGRPQRGVVEIHELLGTTRSGCLVTSDGPVEGSLGEVRGFGVGSVAQIYVSDPEYGQFPLVDLLDSIGGAGTGALAFTTGPGTGADLGVLAEFDVSAVLGGHCESLLIRTDSKIGLFESATAVLLLD